MPSSNTFSAEKLSSQGSVKNCTQVPTHSHLRLKCPTTPMKKHEHTNEILLVSIASCNVDNNHFKAIPWAKCWYRVLKVQSIGNNWWRASFIYSLYQSMGLAEVKGFLSIYIVPNPLQCESTSNELRKRLPTGNHKPAFRLLAQVCVCLCVCVK